MIKKIFYLFLLLIPSLSFSQNILDSTVSYGHLGGIYYHGRFVSSLLKYNNTQSDLNIYNDSLQLIKTIARPSNVSDSLFFHFFFHFNGRLYAKAYKIGSLKEYLLEVKPNSMQQINQFMDTVRNASIVQIDSVEENTLQLIFVKKTDSTALYDQTVIIDLDSNFNMKSYRLFKFDSLLGMQDDIIDYFYQINDSIAHIFAGHVFIKYNLNHNRIDTAYYLRGHIYSTFRISPSEYLALGHMLVPDPVYDSITWAPIYGDDALGFYRMNIEGYPVDTSYFLHNDSSQQGANPSFLNINGRTTKGVIDSNNIYLTANVTIPDFPIINQKGFAWVIKIDSRGHEKWRYQFGGANKVFGINALTLTPNGGCAVFGYYGKTINNSITAIRIKLGPDGTLNDVEIQAPENVVQFYPNPVKDILHYNYLPAAKGHYQLSVYDMKGTLSGQFELSSGEGVLPLNLSPGFYLYDLSDTNKKTIQVGKLVVQ